MRVALAGTRLHVGTIVVLSRNPSPSASRTTLTTSLTSLRHSACAWSIGLADLGLEGEAVLVLGTERHRVAAIVRGLRPQQSPGLSVAHLDRHRVRARFGGHPRRTDCRDGARDHAGCVRRRHLADDGRAPSDGVLCVRRGHVWARVDAVADTVFVTVRLGEEHGRGCRAVGDVGTLVGSITSSRRPRRATSSPQGCFGWCRSRRSAENRRRWPWPSRLRSGRPLRL